MVTTKRVKGSRSRLKRDLDDEEGGHADESPSNQSASLPKAEDEDLREKEFSV